MKRSVYLRYILLVMLLAGAGKTLLASTDPPVIQVLSGQMQQIGIDSTSMVEDSKFFNPAYNGKLVKPYMVRNRVTFRVNESSSYVVKTNFTASVTVRIVFTKADNSLDSVTQVLSLAYRNDSLYTSQSSYVFKNAYRVRVRILDTISTGGWNVWRVLAVENELQSFPEYVFSCTNDAVQTVSYVSLPADTKADELQVSWPNQMAADEYDLEWTYIDSAALDAGRYGNPASPDPNLLFENNASRVSVSGTSYSVPLIYDGKGSLFFRVRSVKLGANGAHITSTWSSAYTNGMGRFNFNGHENSLNWQATTSFSEEGKRKTAIQYFDGTLRGRQTVTKDNVTGTTIVAESFYDHQGRAAIQVLPTPTLDNIIHYSKNFNIGLNGDGYGKDIFDDLTSLGSFCNTGAPPMGLDSGAARYYSVQNPEKNAGMHQYIPNGNGYVFTETQYTQDNTGRVNRQGGVGEKFRIGGGHETRYYYGSPDQQELDALFGTEAGVANHYFKTMVRDANGQYSVSYTNMIGKTVATALAGVPADSIKLQHLPSLNTKMITEKLADPKSAVLRDLVMESKKGLLVSKAGPHQFAYNLSPESLSAEDCNQNLVCYDCLYDLRITITDNCNNQLLGGQAFDTTFRNFSLTSIDTTCSQPAGFSIQFTKYLEEGSYDITKTLTVSKFGMDYYRDSIYAKRNLCRDTASFIHEQDSLIALVQQCIPTCSSCIDSLGTWESFRVKFMQKANIATADTASFRSMALVAYEDAMDNCKALCGTVNELDRIRDAMLLDLTPSSGQYANLDNEADKYSIFYTDLDDDSAPDTVAHFRKPLIYKDADGNRDFVFDEQANATVQPQQLSAESFAQKFKLSWAEALLPYHPEYCKLLQYEAIKLSHEWDQRFGSVETFAEARKKGYLNPTANTGAPYNKYNGQAGMIDSDPLAVTYSNGTNNFKTQLEANLLEYRNNNINGSAGISIWGLSTIYVMCRDNNTGTCFTTFGNNANAFDTTGMCAGDLDMAWRSFRQMYLDIKKDIISVYINSACNNQPGGVSASVLVAAGHQPHFSNATELLGLNGMTPPQDQTQANQAQQQAAANAGDYYSSNCLSYVTRWWQQLAPCSFTAVDSAIIVPRLLQVCAEGSDQTHPFGASSVRPASTYRFRSFEQVLQQYSDSTQRAFGTNACNVYLIPDPPPYDRPVSYAPVEVWSKPDTCQCNVITNLYNRYQPVSGQYASFSAYVNQKYGTTMTENDLQTLRGMCNNTVTCRFLPKPIVVPTPLQCGSELECAECKDVAAVYSQFLLDYSGAHRILPNNETTRQQFYNLFTNYMNTKMGFKKKYDDYINFFNQCGIAYYTPSASVPFVGGVPITAPVIDPAYINLVNCDTLQDIVSDFNTLYPATGAFKVVTLRKMRTFYPSIEYLLAGGGIHHPYPPARIVNPQQWIGSGLRDSGYSAKWFRNNLTFVRFDFPGMSRNAVIDSVNLKLSPVLSQAFDPEVYWCNMSTAWDTTLTYNQLGVAYNGFKISSYTPLYQSVTSLGNPVYTYDCKTQMATVVKFANTNRGNVLTSFMDPAVTAGNSQTFVGSADPLATSDPGTRPHMDVWYSVDTVYTCEDFITHYFNTRLKANYTYQQIKDLYLTKCGVALPLSCAQPTATLCGRREPVFGPVTEPEIDNCTDNTFFAVSKGTEMYIAYRDSIENRFDSLYRAKCLNAYKYETFTVTHEVSEYHYTLYYYDQAGNLVKTIPPEGVHPNYNQSYLDSVSNARANGTVKVPVHTLATQYRYNTLNQVIAQYSPDGGESHFWYDRLGRLAISQNAKQIVGAGDGTGRRYSYTIYDELGRITEVGQALNGTANHMTDAISRNAASLSAWLANVQVSKSEITKTVYDQPYAVFVGDPAAPIVQRNLRNRVSYTSIAPGGIAEQYSQASFFTYDAHGNVDTLVQDYGNGSVTGLENVMNLNGNRFKKLVYRFDLVSGKVNHVAYQAGKADQFYHRYTYDADNKLLQAETSADSVHWEKDGRYNYYKHGPLARTIIGDQQVQGVDYAYTLQGWIKGVNSSSLSSSFDIGGDGKANGINQFVARDAFSYSLNFYNGEYDAISGLIPFSGTSAYLGTSYRPLYNGNIGSMTVNLGGSITPLLYNYTYDQLNRLVAMDAYSGLNQGTNSWSTMAVLQDYKERVAYDANGNILQYLRNGAASQLSMDSMNYKYERNAQGQLINNRLNHVRDNVNAGNYTVDIDNQSANNYTYDEIGNLVTDNASGITAIGWTVYGKIAYLTKTGDPDGVTRVDYSYDATGNRVAKKVTKAGAGKQYITWYVRDAQGSVIATYQSEGNTESAYSTYGLTLQEQHIYGSKRLGIFRRNVDMKAAFNPSAALQQFVRGNKVYELENHLSNVLVTISDKKTGQWLVSDPDMVLYYNADVLSRQDYYPFGMGMVGRESSAGGGYRYGYSGQEKDDEIFGDGNAYYFDYRVHESRLGRFLSLDPLTKDFPWNSPYAFAENTPIRFIELEGKERAEPVMFELAKEMINNWRKDIATSGNNTTLVKNLTRTQVVDQLESMMNLIHNQTTISSCNSEGWFCGPLAALGAAAVNNPMAYASMVWDLATTGKTNRDGEIRKGITLPDWVADADMSGGSFKGYRAVDIIMMFSLRDSENDHAKKGQDLINNYSQNGAGTLPWEMNDMFRRMGMGVAGQSFYRGQTNGTLRKLENAVKDGYTPVIFDNEIITTGRRSEMLKTDIGGGVELNVGIHYIVLLDFKRDKANKTVNYSIMEHGKVTTHTGISYKDFKKGMKGYWIPKNKSK